jgi:hypothetical protein
MILFSLINRKVPTFARLFFLAQFAGFTNQLKRVSAPESGDFQEKSDQLMSLVNFQRLTLARYLEIELRPS